MNFDHYDEAEEAGKLIADEHSQLGKCVSLFEIFDRMLANYIDGFW